MNIDFLLDFGANLALFWDHFGRPGRLWGHLEASWARLGGLLGRLWPVLCATWRVLARLGRVWARLGCVLARFGSKNHPQHKPV